MHINWAAFTPWTSLAGGMLIGLAVALLLVLNGRIAGISGIVGGILGGLLRPARGDRFWRLAFVAGLVLAPLLYGSVTRLPEVLVSAHGGTLIVAGLLVGIGTRYAAGCTSGHGVCGLSRLSRRSAVATACFMAAGFATVFVMRHWIS